MKSNTIKLSDAANTNNKTLTVQKDMNLSGAIEDLAKLIPNPSEYTDKIDARLSSIQMQAFNILEYTQKVKMSGNRPNIVDYEYITGSFGVIEDNLEEIGSLVGEINTQT
jgi:hypothetical protein